MIEEGLHPEMVAGAEQPLPLGVPDGEGEVAEQPLGAGLAPAAVGGQHQRRVGDGRVGEAEGRDQRLAVVEPQVGGDGQAVVDQGLRRRVGFGGRGVQAVAQGDAAERAQGPAVRRAARPWPPAWRRRRPRGPARPRPGRRRWRSRDPRAEVGQG